MDVTSAPLVNHIKTVHVCQFVHTFSHPLQQTSNRAMGFLNFGEKDVGFERKNWQPHRGFRGNAGEIDDVREVSVRVCSFLYI